MLQGCLFFCRPTRSQSAARRKHRRQIDLPGCSASRSQRLDHALRLCHLRLAPRPPSRCLAKATPTASARSPRSPAMGSGQSTPAIGSAETTLQFEVRCAGSAAARACGARATASRALSQLWPRPLARTHTQVTCRVPMQKIIEIVEQAGKAVMEVYNSEVSARSAGGGGVCSRLNHRRAHARPVNPDQPTQQ